MIHKENLRSESNAADKKRKPIAIGIGGVLLATSCLVGCTEPQSAECVTETATNGSNGISMVKSGVEKAGADPSNIENIVSAGQELSKSLHEVTNDPYIQPGDKARVCIDESSTVVTEVVGLERK